MDVSDGSVCGGQYFSTDRFYGARQAFRGVGPAPWARQLLAPHQVRSARALPLYHTAPDAANELMSTNAAASETRRRMLTVLRRGYGSVSPVARRGPGGRCLGRVSMPPVTTVILSPAYTASTPQTVHHAMKLVASRELRRHLEPATFSSEGKA